MLRQSHKKKVKYCFDDEVSSPPKQKKKAKGNKFDFNTYFDDDEQENQNAPSKMDNFMNTVDTLSDRTHVQDQIHSITTKIRSDSTNQAPSTELQAHEIRRNQAQKTDAQKVATYLHSEQVQYIEDMFSSLLNDQHEIKLVELITKPKFSGNDRFAKQQAFVYLMVDNILKDKPAYVVDKTYKTIQKSNSPVIMDTYSELKKFMIFALRKKSEYQETKASRQWVMLAENKIDEIAQNLMKEENFDQAILVSNLQDKVFFESFEFGTSRILKKQFTFLQAKDIKIMPNTSWLIDLSIAIQYFDPNSLQTFILDIFKKYHASANHFKPTLLALTLHFCEKRCIPSLENLIEKMITKEKRLSYLDQILYFLKLKQYRNEFPRLFNKVAQTLLTKIHNPGLFVDILVYSSFNEQQIKSSISLLFDKNPFFSESRGTNIQKVYQAIQKKAEENEEFNILAKQPEQIETLYNWMQCERYINMIYTKKPVHSVQFYISHFSEIQNSKTHSSKSLFEALLKIIVKFELACSYKQSQRRQYYLLLQKLQEKVAKTHDTTIIEGCKAFIELKFKAFWLRDERKLSSLYELFGYLKKLRSDKSTAENAKCFLKNIHKTLETLLLTLDGQLYLGELADEISDLSIKEDFAKSIKKHLKHGESVSNPAFEKSRFFKLLEMSDWNESICNFIVLKLLF